MIRAKWETWRNRRDFKVASYDSTLWVRARCGGGGGLKNLCDAYCPRWATAVKNEWGISDGDMMNAETAHLASETRKLGVCINARGGNGPCAGGIESETFGIAKLARTAHV